MWCLGGLVSAGLKKKKEARENSHILPCEISQQPKNGHPHFRIFVLSKSNIVFEF
jgi:hypothetical protein